MDTARYRLPGADSAYEWLSCVAFMGNVARPSVFQHEVGHALDFYKNAVQSSAQPNFRNAIYADSCVPDDYSNASETEDYAQIGVVSLYEIVAPGGLDTIGELRCLVNQKNVLDAYQRDAMIPGGTCTRRWADSAVHAMSGAKLVKDAVPPAPLNILGMPGITEEISYEEMTEARSPVTVWAAVEVNQTARRDAVIRQDGWMMQWKKDEKRAERLAAIDKK